MAWGMEELGDQSKVSLLDHHLNQLGNKERGGGYNAPPPPPPKAPRVGIGGK
jgi:hypothetical protein